MVKVPDVLVQMTPLFFYTILDKTRASLIVGSKNHTSCYNMNPRAHSHGLLRNHSVGSAYEFEMSLSVD